ERLLARRLFRLVFAGRRGQCGVDLLLETGSAPSLVDLHAEALGFGAQLFNVRFAAHFSASRMALILAFSEATAFLVAASLIEAMVPLAVPPELSVSFVIAAASE